jgi:hypothetical protein
MTMKIIVVNDDSTRDIEVDTIQISEDTHGVSQGGKLASVTQQDTIKPRDHKEFYLHGTQYITAKEK